MPITYNIFRADGTLDFQVAEGTIVDTHGLTFTGFQKPAYGEKRANNLIKLLENFAIEEDAGNPGNPPVSAIDVPLTGQFWYDKTANALKVYNGTAWVPVSTDVFTNDGPIPVDDGAVSIATARVTLPNTTGGNIIITNITSENDLNAHINDVTDAHDATAIFFNDTTEIPGDNVQLAIIDVQGNLDAHLTDPTDAHDAVDISLANAGSITNDDVQTGLQELEDELNVEQAQITATAANLAAHIADLVDAHDASAISYDNALSGLPAAFDVQAALIELNNAVGGTSSQSVVDSLRVVRAGAQNFTSGVYTKVGFNSLVFGDDFGQFDLITNRYTADFDQIVRVTLSVSINSINDENFMEVLIYKNGVAERRAEEWKWPEDSDPPGDREVSGIIRLDAGEYIEGFVFRASGGGGVAIDTLATRTCMDIDVIKAGGSLPVLGPVRLNNHTITSISEFAAGCSFTAESDGDATGIGTTSISPPFTSGTEWHTSSPTIGIGNDFQIRATLLSGTAPTDGSPLNTWLTMNVNRSWGNSIFVVGTLTSDLQIDIRDVATMTIQDTGFITLIAQAIPGGGGGGGGK